MNGYPYQRLASPNSQNSPTPQAVGAMLQQKNAAMMGGGGPQMGQGPMDGQPPMEEYQGDPNAGGEPMAGQDPNAAEGQPMGGQPMGAPSPMAQVAMQRIPNNGMSGSWDPASEHSPSSTRTALDAAVRASMSKMPGSEMRVTPGNTRERLIALGIPPLEVQLMEQSGQLGDTTHSALNQGA